MLRIRNELQTYHKNKLYT